MKHTGHNLFVSDTLIFATFMFKNYFWAAVMGFTFVKLKRLSPNF